MLKTRVIPALLLKNEGLVKTIKFKKINYIGDSINTVRIFNQMEVDELVFLDITATNEQKDPPYELINDIATECFMPFAYGGGICTLEQVKKIFRLGVEKVIINSYAYENPDFIREVAGIYGSQSVIVSIDVMKNFFGKYEVYIKSGRKNTHKNPEAYAQLMESSGAGEIFVNSIDKDGTWGGYDTKLIKKITSTVSIPVIACGGAGSVEDLGIAVKEGGASAVAAGSMFFFQGKDLGVLINFPAPDELQAVLN